MHHKTAVFLIKWAAQATAFKMHQTAQMAPYGVVFLGILAQTISGNKGEGLEGFESKPAPTRSVQTHSTRHRKQKRSKSDQNMLVFTTAKRHLFFLRLQ